MKRLVLLGCLITLIGCARQKTDAEYWMLKGRVAEMREGSAKAYLKFGKWVPDTIDRYDKIHTFDNSGRWMESRVFEKESYDEPNYVVQRSPGDSTVRIEYGYNRDHENLPQVNIGLLVDQKSRLPLYFCLYNGSLNDATQLPYVLQDLKEMGLSIGLIFTMDRDLVTLSEYISCIVLVSSFLLAYPYHALKVYMN